MVKLTGNLQQTNLSTDLQQANLSTNLQQTNLSTDLQQTNLSANFQKKNLSGSILTRLNIPQSIKHNKLVGLTYEESGHIGFASEQALQLVENNAVPRRLEMVSTMSNMADRSKAYLFVDNNGKDERVSIKDIISKVIRTAGEKPDDMQTGEYLFLKK